MRTQSVFILLDCRTFRRGKGRFRRPFQSSFGCAQRAVGVFLRIGGGGIRTPEGISQQIYSLPPLSTWVLHRRYEERIDHANHRQSSLPINLATFVLKYVILRIRRANNAGPQ
jgi:hypothetical protein